MFYKDISFIHLFNMKSHVREKKNNIIDTNGNLQKQNDGICYCVFRKLMMILCFFLFCQLTLGHTCVWAFSQCLVNIILSAYVYLCNEYIPENSSSCMYSQLLFAWKTCKRVPLLRRFARACLPFSLSLSTFFFLCIE
jgi:hypothetical protein